MLYNLNELGFKGKFKSFGVLDEFIEHDSVKNQLIKCGITADEIINSINNL